MTTTLIEHFSEIHDHRQAGKIEHKLIDIVILSICASICGADGWEMIENFGKTRLKWLKKFLALKNGIPSHDTIARVMSRINPNQLQSCFTRWIDDVNEISEGEIIALDGKTLRGALRRGGRVGAIHMVSAWACKNGVVMGQQAVDSKENELSAIPKLLQLLDLKGCIVTMDAMGTQKNHTKQIIEQKGDYVLAVKANHPILYQNIQDYFLKIKRRSLKRRKAVSYHKEDNIGHGRIESRQNYISTDLSTISQAEQWAGLTAIGMVESCRTVKGVTSVEQRFYLCSKAFSAKKFGATVRAHWGIENGLHWRMDVGMNEDACPIFLNDWCKCIRKKQCFRGFSFFKLACTRTKIIGFKTSG